ncbi:MAG: ABC transporter ATP-binding protein [Chloroflexota bacterium]
MLTQDNTPEAAAESSDENMLEVEGLRTYFKTMDGIVKAVDGVTFSIPPASSTGIVGESGSGKSITVMSIMRLIEQPGWIADGRITFQGKDLTRASEEQMRRIRGDEITMVFQEPMTALNPVFTVGDQVAEVIRAHRKISRKAAMALTVELLGMVGIPSPHERIRAYPHNLSGGMRQRVMIAMALANDPSLLILDEPTTALDVTTQAQILELIKDLRQKLNTAVLLVTHDLAVVAETCEAVIVMYGGKIMEQGDAVQVIKQPSHPYTRGLLASMPQRGTKGQRLSVIEGAVANPLNMPPGCPFAPRCPNAMEVCKQMPELRILEDGRRVACWLYDTAGARGNDG